MTNSFTTPDTAPPGGGDQGAAGAEAPGRGTVGGTTSSLFSRMYSSISRQPPKIAALPALGLRL